MIVLGVDPGLTGAIAAVHSERGLLACADLPVCANGLASGSMLQWVDVGRLLHLLQGWSREHDMAREFVGAVIERPIAMPRLPAQTIAAQFDTFAAIRGALIGTLSDKRVAYVTPNEWKRRYGLHAEKADSRACALRLFPTAPLERKKDHNRAEAILIAHFHLRTVHGATLHAAVAQQEAAEEPVPF